MTEQHRLHAHRPAGWGGDVAAGCSFGVPHPPAWLARRQHVQRDQSRPPPPGTSRPRPSPERGEGAAVGRGAAAGLALEAAGAAAGPGLHHLPALAWDGDGRSRAAALTPGSPGGRALGASAAPAAGSQAYLWRRDVQDRQLGGHLGQGGSRLPDPLQGVLLHAAPAAGHMRQAPGCCAAGVQQARRSATTGWQAASGLRCAQRTQRFSSPALGAPPTSCAPRRRSPCPPCRAATGAPAGAAPRRRRCAGNSWCPR